MLDCIAPPYIAVRLLKKYRAMKKENKQRVRIRKPVAKKATTVIVPKTDKLKRKRVRSKELIKRLRADEDYKA